MKPLDLVNFFLAALFLLMFSNSATSTQINMVQREQNEYSEKFKTAVDDVGYKMSALEAQQVTTGIRYSAEKNIAVDGELIKNFYEDLALNFGVEGDPYSVQDIMLHIPVIAMVRFDGYQMVTINDITTSSGVKEYRPTMGPLKPFTYQLPNGTILFFRLDDTLTLYDRNTNQYLQGTYDKLKVVRDLSPLTSKEKFEEARRTAITKAVENDMAGAVNKHIETTKGLNLAVEFTLPTGVDDLSIENTGFFAFMQGYPLPTGQMLTSYAFGGARVRVGSQYFGVIRLDGRHVAYPVGVTIPEGSAIIETLADDQEAAKKGYFVEYGN